MIIKTIIIDEEKQRIIIKMIKLKGLVILNF